MFFFFFLELECFASAEHMDAEKPRNVHREIRSFW